MSSNGPLAAPETRKGYWGRVLWPLLWWLMLALALTAIHQHQVWIERTRLYFTVTLYQTIVLNDAVVMLDGRRIASGEKISPGSHRLTITQAKADSWSTNFFAWYGPHDLGKINLQRAMGTLAVRAEPAAQSITIAGPELGLTLHDSTGTNLLVPTDGYRVSAHYARWSDARDCVVPAGKMASCTFAPQLGAVSVTCNESPATYELQDGNDNLVERGDVPAVITGLPDGQYFVLATYHNHSLKQGIFVGSKETNAVPFHFAFGAVRLESEPSGAGVYTTDGTYLGATPLVIVELPPGRAECRMQLNGYDAATVSATVTENQTNTASATLVSLAYLDAMRDAKGEMAAHNYHAALDSLAQAFRAKPGDTQALALQPEAEAGQRRQDTEAKAQALVQQAKDLVASRSDYIAADLKLRDALAIQPDDAAAKQLVAEYQPQEAAEMVKIKAWRTRDLFDQACKANRITDLFDEHSVTVTNMTLEAFRDALIQNCETIMPTLKATGHTSPESGLCKLELLQASDNPLVTARRECLMVIGTDKAGQTLVLFKLLEYQRKLGFQVNLNRLDSITAGNPNEWIPLHSSRIQMTPAYEEQIQVGIEMLMKHITDSIRPAQ